MEPQGVFNVVAAAALSVLGWVARSVYSAIRALEVDLSEHKIAVARDYVTNEDLKEIKDALVRIEAAVHSRGSGDD